MLKKITISIVPIGLLMLSCNKKELPEKEVNISFFRYDSAIYSHSWDSAFVEYVLDSLYPAHPRMTEDFFIIHRMGKPTDTTAIENLQKLILQDPYMQELYDSVKVAFPTEFVQKKVKELHTALRKLKAIYPNMPDYQIYTYVAPFVYKCFVDSNILAWELDMYLGPKFKYYPSLHYPLYMIRKFRHEYMVPDMLKVIMENLFPPPDPMPHLLAHMIYNGKILYVIEQLLPEYHDTILIGWEGKKWEWVKQYEADLWEYFLKHDLLYNNEYIKYRKYVQDGNTTAGLPPESPGNIGTWIGWQIVRAYMEKHPETTLYELLTHPDTTGQYILQASGYRPKAGWLDFLN